MEEVAEQDDDVGSTLRDSELDGVRERVGAELTDDVALDVEGDDGAEWIVDFVFVTDAEIVTVAMSVIDGDNDGVGEGVDWSGVLVDDNDNDDGGTADAVALAVADIVVQALASVETAADADGDDEMD